MAERVEFVVTDLYRHPALFVLRLFAALAEKERALISERTRAGLESCQLGEQRLSINKFSSRPIRRLPLPISAAFQASVLRKSVQHSDLVVIAHT